jgi:hypothetical protein
MKDHWIASTSHYRAQPASLTFISHIPGFLDVESPGEKSERVSKTDKAEKIEGQNKECGYARR